MPQDRRRKEIRRNKYGEKISMGVHLPIHNIFCFGFLVFILRLSPYFLFVF